MYIFTIGMVNYYGISRLQQYKHCLGGKTQDGKTLYAGTYFYIIEIDTKKPMKGWVEITSTSK